MATTVAKTILRTDLIRSLVLGCFLLVAMMKMDSVAKAADAPQASDAPPVRLNPVPDAASQASALKVLKQIFKPYPPQTQEGKASLAQKLIEQGASSDSDPASQFVVWREASDLAASAGDVRTALHAIDERARRFAIDGVSEKLAVLGRAKSAHLTPAAAQGAAEAAIQIGWQSLRNGEFDAAGRAAALATTMARESQDVKLNVVAQALAADARRGQQEAVRAKLATDKLAGQPGDPTANLTLGRFLCLWRGDWTHGLPLIAQGADAGWKSLAAIDLAGPTDAKTQFALAEKWMALLEKETGIPRQQIGQHARTWYEQASTGLGGLEKVLAEKRAAELGDVNRVEPTVAAAQNLPPGPPNRRVLFFHGNNREEPVFQQISKGQMRNVAQTETAATLANAGSFASVGIVVLGNEFLRDTPAAGFSDGVGRNLKHFVDGGGDLVVFE